MFCAIYYSKYLHLGFSKSSYFQEIQFITYCVLWFIGSDFFFTNALIQKKSNRTPLAWFKVWCQVEQNLKPPKKKTDCNMLIERTGVVHKQEYTLFKSWAAAYDSWRTTERCSLLLKQAQGYGRSMHKRENCVINVWGVILINHVFTAHSKCHSQWSRAATALDIPIAGWKHIGLMMLEWCIS